MIYLTAASHFDILMPFLLLLPMNMTLGSMNPVVLLSWHYRSVPELIALS